MDCDRDKVSIVLFSARVRKQKTGSSSKVILWKSSDPRPLQNPYLPRKRAKALSAQFITDSKYIWLHYQIK